MNIKNPFCLSVETGEIIHISDFLKSEEMKEIVCPNCNNALIPKALESDKMVAHFAHLNLEMCSGYESALHNWAKNIFKELIGQKIVLPSVPEIYLSPKKIREIRNKISLRYAEYRNQMSDYLQQEGYWIKGWHLKNYFEGLPELDKWCMEVFLEFISLSDNEVGLRPEIFIEDVEVEVNFNELIVDTLINKEYAVEIFVTHKIDENKEKLLKQMNLDTIEINLSKLGKEVYDKKSIINYLTCDVSRKKVFGSFNQLYKTELEFPVVVLNAFEEFIFEKSKRFLDTEVEELREIKRTKENSIFKEIELNPTEYFIKVITGQKTFKDYKIKRIALDELHKRGYPIYQEVIDLIDYKKQRYSFDFHGTVEFLNHTEFNKMYFLADCRIQFDDYDYTFEIQIKIKKGEFKRLNSEIKPLRIKKFSTGWGIPLLVFE